jgi:hypothetical protein
MRIAWELLSEEDRALALELDYELVHNYWPNLNFLNESWRAEVENVPIILMGASH